MKFFIQFFISECTKDAQNNWNKTETMNCLQKLFPAINVFTKERMFWSSVTEFVA